jgi:hypothetical protein
MYDYNFGFSDDRVMQVVCGKDGEKGGQNLICCLAMVVQFGLRHA